MCLKFLSNFDTKLLQHFAYKQDGKLVERRLHQRKWKWVVYGSPKDQRLTSITPVLQDDTNERLFSLFFTTSTGSVFEYQISKQSGEFIGGIIEKINYSHLLTHTTWRVSQNFNLLPTWSIQEDANVITAHSYYIVST